jgi:type IV pilus assembly protein PilV
VNTRRPAPDASAAPSPQGGFALLEVLIAIVVSVVGILGLIGMQARSYQVEAESYQRSQALALLDDIASRINANRASAASYVAADIGTGAVADCSAAGDAVAADLCDIGNNLRGAGETAGGAAVGAMTQARACITSPAADTYVIAVVWAGVVPSGPPATVCGANQYGDEDLRRAVTTVVVVPDLGA